MKITRHKVVSIDYTLTNNAGEVLDSSKDRQPLAYIHGTGSLIPGLETELEGKGKGDALSVSIAPENAYGEKDEELVQDVPRAAFEGADKVEVGMQFQAQSSQGMRVVTVVAVNDDSVTVDANHPLAGQTLNFDVTVMEVRDATEEEISHGHVHGAGGHQH